MRAERSFSSVPYLADTQPEKAGKSAAATPEMAFRHQTPLTQRFLSGKMLFIK